MRWLIVEDALRNRQGHWFEYLTTFARGLKALGDDVTILVDREAESFIQESLPTRPVLPASIWHRMSDGAGAMTRYLRVPVHAWQTWRAVRRVLREDAGWDIIFVPTVLVHHLLGWYALAGRTLRRKQTRLLLFFPNLPIRLEADGTPRWHASPTTRLMRLLLSRLGSDIVAGRIILGVETQEMRTAFAQLSGLPVRYLPHPVAPLATEVQSSDSGEILLACYGPARPEKGSDILQEAIRAYLTQGPEKAAQFAFQWIEGFKNEHGVRVELAPFLASHPQVNVITRYFAEGEYARHLCQTHVMLLPYRKSSYGLRVSRVIIEAMVNGIPAVATDGTTLRSQAGEFGAAIDCKDGSVESLLEAIKTAVQAYPELRARARQQMPLAREHFSVRHFRALLGEETNSPS